MNIKTLTKHIMEGYNSIPLDIPMLKCDCRSYNYKDKDFEFDEYAFEFPYYYNKEDLYKVGVLLRKLKIATTYSKDASIERLIFHGNVFPIEKIESLCIDTLFTKKPNKDCEVIIQRVPLEIMTDGKLGYACIYERYRSVLKSEVEEKINAI